MSDLIKDIDEAIEKGWRREDASSFGTIFRLLKDAGAALKRGRPSGKFYLQERSLSFSEIWYTAFERYKDDLVFQSDSVSELRKTLETIADTRTLSFWAHYRIITQDGAAVERYKVKPGRLVKTRARY